MPVRDSALQRGTRRGRRILTILLQEAEDARVARGLSYAAVGRALHLSSWQVARLLHGEARDLGVLRVAELLAVVGLELSARAYPSGAPIRDAAHVALLARFRGRLPADARFRTEVPVVGPVIPGEPLDLRAWDAVVDTPGLTVHVEAETRLGDVQAFQRRVALKQRDGGGVVCVVLLLSDTRHNRAAVRLAGRPLVEQFPVPPRRALRRLAAGQSPGGNAIVLL